MRRVLIIGSGGAGKSTLAVRLGAATGLPVVHLDAHYWRPGWEKTSDDQWRQRVAELISREAWIMDGNYGGSLETRLAACDTVVFLDLPRVTCLWGVVARWLRFRGKSRPYMAPGCPEHLTLEFVRWIWTYPALRRPKILERLAALEPNQRVVILKARRDVDTFVRLL